MEKSNQLFQKSIKIVGFVMIATILARALGFLREMTIAFKYGTSIYSDAFIAAFSLPDILSNGFGAAISTLYVPLYIKALKNEKRESYSFNSITSIMLLSIALVIITLFSLFPEAFVKLFVGGFDDETMRITVQLSRVMIFSSISVLVSQHYKAYSQIKNKYGWALLFECVINVSIIIGILLVRQDWIIILAYIDVGAKLAYSIIMFIFSYKNDFRYSKTFSFRNKYFKELLKGVLPVLLANLILEINQIVDKNFASNLVTGTVSALNYSSKIINLITAIFGTTISTIYFPSLSQKAAQGDKKGFTKNVYKLNSAILFIVIPILFFVICYAQNIVTCLFGRGNFDDESIKITTNCLIFYSFTIIGANLKSIWTRIYNAELNTKTPAINSVISVLINIALNFALINVLQERGLALATSIASISTAIILIVFYKKHNQEYRITKIVIDVLKMIIAACVFIPLFFTRNYLSFNCWVNLIIELVIFVVSFAIYFFACKFMKCNIFQKESVLIYEKESD
jgi:putative peptidoglycan lipid II flippase